MKSSITKIKKYALVVVCTVALLISASIPIIRLSSIDSSLEPEITAFEQAMQEDFNNFAPSLELSVETFHYLSPEYVTISFSIKNKNVGMEGATRSNALLMAHVRDCCLEYLENHQSSRLYRIIRNGSGDTSLYVSCLLNDYAYHSYEIPHSLNFSNDYRSHLLTTSADQTNRVFDKLDSLNVKLRMEDLMYFKDVSQIFIQDILTDQYEEYDFSQFTNLRHLYLADLTEADAKKIYAIKQTLPKDCKLWIQNTSTTLKEVK